MYSWSDSMFHWDKQNSRWYIKKRLCKTQNITFWASLTKSPSGKGILYIWIIKVTCRGQHDWKDISYLTGSFWSKQAWMTDHPPLQQHSQSANGIRDRNASRYILNPVKVHTDGLYRSNIFLHSKLFCNHINDKLTCRDNYLPMINLATAPGYLSHSLEWMLQEGQLCDM